MLLYSLNGLSQFDTSLGQLARFYSADGQQKYNEWQILELLSAVFAICGIICLVIGLVMKNEIKHANYNQSPAAP